MSAFIATDWLRAILSGYSFNPSATQDLESFGWVALYVIYRRALDERLHPDSRTRSAIAEEFHALFAAYNIEDLFHSRMYHFSFRGVIHLRTYANNSQHLRPLEFLIRYTSAVLDGLHFPEEKPIVWVCDEDPDLAARRTQLLNLAAASIYRRPKKPVSHESYSDALKSILRKELRDQT